MGDHRKIAFITGDNRGIGLETARQLGRLGTLVVIRARDAGKGQAAAHLAHELRDTPIKVNSAHPGWVKTDMGGTDAELEVADGANTGMQLATLPPAGPSGGFFHFGETVPW